MLRPCFRRVKVRNSGHQSTCERSSFGKKLCSSCDFAHLPDCVERLSFGSCQKFATDNCYECCHGSGISVISNAFLLSNLFQKLKTWFCCRKNSLGKISIFWNDFMDCYCLRLWINILRENNASSSVWSQLCFHLHVFDFIFIRLERLVAYNAPQLPQQSLWSCSALFLTLIRFQ